MGCPRKILVNPPLVSPTTAPWTTTGFSKTNNADHEGDALQPAGGTAVEVTGIDASIDNIQMNPLEEQTITTTIYAPKIVPPEVEFIPGPGDEEPGGNMPARVDPALKVSIEQYTNDVQIGGVTYDVRLLPRPAGIPTLTNMGLVLLALILASAGAAVIFHRKRTA